MVSMVIPTFRRLDALKDTVPFLLAVRGVDELVFVDDCSRDGSVAWLEALDDPRVRVVELERRSGLCAVRNRGIAETRGDWVVMGEDDCRFPPDYVEVLLRDAEAVGADVISAPWLFLTKGEPVDEAVAQARAGAVDAIALDQVQTYPVRPLATPFLCALALIRRSVLDVQRYDVGFTGNAYREETDFFLRAERAGFSCWLTPATYSWQVQRWPGGAHMPKWRYEVSTVRNNGRFLRRHGRELQRRGLAGPPVAVQARFTAARAKTTAEAYLRPLAGRALRAVGAK
jgi:glycosyltransferase involved in cell wall biosynthesis